MAEHQIQFQMEMRAFPVYPDSSVTHDCDGLAAFDRVARMHCDRAKMSVQAVVIRAVPAVFDHDVFPVVRVTGDEVGVHDFAVGNRAHFVERLAVFIAVHWANIDSFVKAGVNHATCRVDGIAHKTVLAALPRRRFHAVVIAFDVLIKRGAVTREQRVIVRRQNKIEI